MSEAMHLKACPTMSWAGSKKKDNSGASSIKLFTPVIYSNARPGPML